MTVTHVAADNVVFHTLYLLTALGVPTVGWILVVVGLKQRSDSGPPPGAPPGAPPRQQPTPQRGRSPGTRLIVIGAVLMMVGALAIVWRLATAEPRSSARSLSAEFSSCTVILSSAAIDDDHAQTTCRAFDRLPTIAI